MKYYGMRIDYFHDMEFARIYLESFCDEIMLKHSNERQQLASTVRRDRLEEAWPTSLSE
jgi:hypothetical protein